MFEQMSYEIILNRMIDRIKENINLDTTEGSIIYTAIAPEAYELALAYSAIEQVYDTTYADTAPRCELIRRAKERGLMPFEATNAILKGEFNISVPIGTRFTYNDMTYSVIEKIGDKEFKLQSEKAGVKGNRHIGDLIAIDYVDGLTEAKITEILIPGVDEEATEAFRKRYFASFKNTCFGGNRADYKEKITSIRGVGGAKIKRVTKEDHHINACIITSDYDVPSLELLSLVQETIDPPGKTGQGDGLAPIGHVVVITGVKARTINIAFSLTLDGYKYEDVKSKVETAIDEYILELCKEWESADGLTFRISQLEAKIVSVPGVLDIENTTLNGNPSNIKLSSEQIPKRGRVDVS